MNRKLLNLLRSDLNSPRILRTEVAMSLATLMGVEEPLRGLCDEKRLAELEECQVESLISTMFTPGHEEREIYQSLLPDDGVDGTDIKEIVTCLVKEKVSCPVMCGDTMGSLVIPEMVISRYVRLLHLDNGVPNRVAELLREMAKGEALNKAFALARLSNWQGAKRKELIVKCLEAMRKRNSFDIEKLNFLTEFVHNLRPLKLSKLEQALSELVVSYSNSEDYQPVFDQSLGEYQANAIPSQNCDDAVKYYRTTMAEAILEDLKQASGAP